MVIAKTEHGKVIGGYTPLHWVASATGEYRADKTDRSFLFSLSLNEKYELVRPMNTIYCRSDFGPTFGGGYDLHISNSCQNNTYSHSDFPHSYNNGKYKNNAETYRKFHGNSEGTNMKIKEWEVFKVNFTEDKVIQEPSLKAESSEEADESPEDLFRTI